MTLIVIDKLKDIKDECLLDIEGGIVIEVGECKSYLLSMEVQKNRPPFSLMWMCKNYFCTCWTSTTATCTATLFLSVVVSSGFPLALYGRLLKYHYVR